MILLWRLIGVVDLAGLVTPSETWIGFVSRVFDLLVWATTGAVAEIRDQLLQRLRQHQKSGSSECIHGNLLSPNTWSCSSCVDASRCRVSAGDCVVISPEFRRQCGRGS